MHSGFQDLFSIAGVVCLWREVMKTNWKEKSGSAFEHACIPDERDPSIPHTLTVYLL